MPELSGAAWALLGLVAGLGVAGLVFLEIHREWAERTERRFDKIEGRTLTRFEDVEKRVAKLERSQER